MPDEVDIERQRHELPPLLGEVPQMLEQLLGVGPTIGPRQVPDVDGILDLWHGIIRQRHAISTVTVPERFRRRANVTSLVPVPLPEFVRRPQLLETGALV
jgi:hypothetical protein